MIHDQADTTQYSAQDPVVLAFQADQLSIFQEIGNIGAGNAATALASMLGKVVDMTVPDVRVVSFNEITHIMGTPDTLVIGILLGMEGALNGHFLMLLTVEDAYDLLSIARAAFGLDPVAREEFNPAEIDPLDESALREMANILVGSYLAAICTMTGLDIEPTQPTLAVDMVGAILNVVTVSYAEIGDSVLFMKTRFNDTQKNIAGNFFLIPDFESYKRLMESLGMGLG
jgi:chemotaxis protein CheC